LTGVEAQRATVALGGELDRFAAPRLAHHLDGVIRSVDTVVLDCSHLSFVDVAGARVIAKAAASFDRGSFTVRAASELARRVFQRCDFDRWIRFED
jgi:anti-anti-sigma factor